MSPFYLRFEKGTLRYFGLIAFLFLGPTVGILELKAFHIITLFLLLTWMLLAVHKKSLNRSEAVFVSLVIFSSIVYLYYGVIMGYINNRYIQYFFYFIISLVILLFSAKAVRMTSKRNLYFIIQTCIFVDIFIALLELFLGISVFSLYPLAGTEYQVGSSFWANVNTNVVVLMIASSALFFSGYKKSAFLNFIPIFILAAAVDAKLCILAMIAQLLFFQFYLNARLRLWFILAFFLLAPIMYFLFTPYFNAAFLAVIQGWDLLSQPETLQAIVSAGDMYSIAIRAYALSEMLQVLQHFSWYNWLLGAGFGSINISFINHKWGGEVNYFSPHFFYLEMLIYGGVFYFFTMLYAMKVIKGHFPWKAIIISLPVLGVIVAISSAVYFMPLYFYLAILSCWNEQTDEVGRPSEE